MHHIQTIVLCLVLLINSNLNTKGSSLYSETLGSRKIDLQQSNVYLTSVICRSLYTTICYYKKKNTIKALTSQYDVNSHRSLLL